MLSPALQHPFASQRQRTSGAGASGRGGAQCRRLDKKYLKGNSAVRVMGTRSGAVSIAAVSDVYYRHHAGLVVDSIDYAVGAAPGAEPVVHRREKPFAYSVGIS